GSPDPGLGLAVLALSVAAAIGGRRRLEAERAALRSLARVDALTGAGNVRLLHERLGYEIARHSRHGRRLALLALDLDGFKAVNDRFGHPAGDELLRDVARELVRAVRSEDTVVRQGGDEFCVVAPEAGPAQAERLAERLEAAVARAGAGLERLSASVGYAVFPDEGEDAAALIARADAEQARLKRERTRAEASPPGRRAA
ncbi:MAG: GGDEF domain-containing protein, partial [Actinomycetota bacterium]|nr:GGDEF domain-containing protein [Actinomycetota bacterium]